jgi:hypothetical protein
MRNLINKNIARIANYMKGDLAVVFPEFTRVVSIETNVGMAILER